MSAASDCWAELVTQIQSPVSTLTIEPCIDIIQKHIDRAVAKATQVNIHNLKTWPEAFEGVWDGTKRHDYRKDDRGFEVGDELVHQEFYPKDEQGTYSGRSCRSRVTFISTSDDPWRIPEGYCVMSLSAPYDKRVP
jgi:hypothetical protein